MKTRFRLRPNDPRGFTMMELLVAIAILVALSAIGITVSRSMQETAHLTKATQKMRDLGSAFVGYTADSGGHLPFEDAPGSDDWTNAAKPE
ncbi:MAG: type II secretion system protein, partial [Akkermansiaceae bacterium]|nr:type II secretion system protein [Akkermansiaceae bacterium]